MAVYFVGLALISKFVIENCFISIFLFIYSENYWAYINEKPEIVMVNFEKLSRLKKRAVERSILFTGLKRNKNGSMAVETQKYIKDDDGKDQPTSMDAKQAEAFRQFANAVKFTKNVRQRRKNSKYPSQSNRGENRDLRASIFQGEFNSELRKSTTTRRVRNPRASMLQEELRKDLSDKRFGSIDLTNLNSNAQGSSSLVSQGTTFGGKAGSLASLYHVTARLKANAVAPSSTRY